MLLRFFCLIPGRPTDEDVFARCRPVGPDLDRWVAIQGLSFSSTGRSDCQLCQALLINISHIRRSLSVISCATGKRMGSLAEQELRVWSWPARTSTACARMW
jgi:hypothetical protein